MTQAEVDAQAMRQLLKELLEEARNRFGQQMVISVLGQSMVAKVAHYANGGHAAPR